MLAELIRFTKSLLFNRGSFDFLQGVEEPIDKQHKK